MELIQSLPEINHEQEIPTKCVDTLVQITTSTRSDDVRANIGEQGGINKLASFIRAFISHPRVSEFFSSPSAQAISSPVYPAIGTNLLRILRNLCANSSANQSEIRTLGICSELIDFIVLALTSPSAETLVTLRAGGQFFGNFVASNNSNAEYFWKLAFPDLFSRMLNANDRQLTEFTLMTLYNCVRQIPSFRNQLVLYPVFKTLVDTLVALHDSHEQSFQWIYFILLSVFSSDLFEQAYEALREPEDLDREQERQLAVLKVLDAMVGKVAEELPRRTGLTDMEDLPKLDEQYVITPNCCSFFVRELARIYNKDFSRVSKAAQAANAAAESGDAAAAAQAAQPVSSVVSTREYELIYFMLCVLGHVTSLVEECESTRMCKNGNDLRTNLGKEGLVALVLGTLRGAWELEQAAKARKEKGALFAPGYKRELMGLIANMTYHNKANQDEVRELGGVELVLNHCNIDDNNPYIREWSIFALRNLLEENEENQAIVKGLKAEKVADTHGVMKEMGIGAELVNGVLKFKQEIPPNLQNANGNLQNEKGGKSSDKRDY